MYFLRLSALVICLLLGSSYGSEQEPRCYSRFDYEEKLLQKTIHTDFQLQEYVRQMDKAMEEIRAHKAEFNDMKASIEKVAEDIKSSVTTTTRELIQEIAEVRESVDTPTIVFNARQAADQSPEKYNVIVLQTVIQNIGNAYDSNTGIFTAPVNGTFMFSIKACKNYQQWTYFRLVVDTQDNVILTISDYQGNAYDTTSSASVATYLTAGQKIWVQSFHNSGSTQTLREQENYCWNQFTGVLLHN